ncbi:MAG: SpoIIE family protein phosphatase [Desulfosalsimonadaceae bacterium]
MDDSSILDTEGIPADPEKHRDPVRVLVADDEAGTRLLLRKKLEEAGYTVICAKNGREAINRLSNSISAAVVDLKMPDIDGMECLRHIRKKFPDLSPIMLTASENIANAVEAMKQGALDYVTKPFNARQLIALIEKAVDSFDQSKRLRETEQKLALERQHQLFVASQIQQSLLLGQPPENFEGLEIAHIAIPSQQIDGDFIDFIRQSPHVLDVVVADVMGKGIMAAFIGAALKSAFLKVLNDAATSSPLKNTPEPDHLVAAVHNHMIAQMERFETFVTLCYGRFEMEKNRFLFVDCGHVRTIHYRHAEKSVTLLRGANMPLGFPESKGFRQFQADFSPGDLFLFYSDGVTEAENPEGELFGETRLVDYVEAAAYQSPENLAAGIRQELSRFTETDIFQDDFTCVAVRITALPCQKRLLRRERLEIESDLQQISDVRTFVIDFCKCLPVTVDEDRLAGIEIAAVEVVANIIKHAYHLKTDKTIEILALAVTDGLELEFRDSGENFDPADVPAPELDGNRENGRGCFIIAQTADEISYFRDETHGKNCTRLKFIWEVSD